MTTGIGHFSALRRCQISVMASQITSNSMVFVKRFSRQTSWKISKPAYISLCEGKPPVTGGFPSKRASDAESASMSWSRMDILLTTHSLVGSLHILVTPKALPFLLAFGVKGIIIHTLQWRYIIFMTSQITIISTVCPIAHSSQHQINRQI